MARQNQAFASLFDQRYNPLPTSALLASQINDCETLGSAEDNVIALTSETAPIQNTPQRYWTF